MLVAKTHTSFKLSVSRKARLLKKKSFFYKKYFNSLNNNLVRLKYCCSITNSLSVMYGFSGYTFFSRYGFFYNAWVLVLYRVLYFYKVFFLLKHSHTETFLSTYNGVSTRVVDFSSRVISLI